MPYTYKRIPPLVECVNPANRSNCSIQSFNIFTIWAQLLTRDHFATPCTHTHFLNDVGCRDYENKDVSIVHDFSAIKKNKRKKDRSQESERETKKRLASKRKSIRELQPAYITFLFSNPRYRERYTAADIYAVSWKIHNGEWVSTLRDPFNVFTIVISCLIVLRCAAAKAGWKKSEKIQPRLSTIFYT